MTPNIASDGEGVPDGTKDKHILNPILTGGAIACSCGRSFNGKSQATQHINKVHPTPQRTPTVLSWIIDGVVDWADSGHTSIGRPVSTLSPKEAKQAIQAWASNLIGEDEEMPKPSVLGVKSKHGGKLKFAKGIVPSSIRARNQLRAEQRKKAGIE